MQGVSQGRLGPGSTLTEATSWEVRTCSPTFRHLSLRTDIVLHLVV